MTNCQNQCYACPFIQERKSVKLGQYTWSINDQVNCERKEKIIYLIQCDKKNCKNKNCWGKIKAIRKRIREHRAYIHRTETDQTTGAHFNKPGHSISNMKITIIEKVKSSAPIYRKECKNTT